MSLKKVPFRALPIRLWIAGALLAIHFTAYVWFVVDGVRSGEKLSPYWILYIIACLLFLPEFRRPQVLSMVMVTAFSLTVPSCMLVTTYNAGNEDTFLGTIVLMVPVYLAVLFVFGTWKFYARAGNTE